MTYRRALWILVPLLLLGFWLGARQLDADAIWLDEYFSIYDAGGGAYGPLTPAEIWNRVATRNPWHAPGYFIALSAWGRLVGWEPAALRAFSLLLGVLAVAGAYRLGRDLISPRVGLYAAVILGTSAFFVYYTHEIRMYTLIALLAEASVWLYARLLAIKNLTPQPPLHTWRGGEKQLVVRLSRIETRQASRGLWLAFLFVLVAVMYTHYLAMFPLVGIALYHMLFAPKNRRWLQIVGVGALAALLYLPWASALFAGVGLAAEAEELHGRALSTRRVLEMFAYFFGNGLTLLTVASLALALPTLRQRRARLIWVVAFGTLAAILLLNQVFQIIPVTRLRYLLSLWPLFAVIVALGLDNVRRWPVLPIAALGLWVALGLYSAGNPEFVSQLASAGYTFPLHRIDDVLRVSGQPGDFVVDYLSPGMASVTYDRTADFYYGRRGMDFDNIEPKQTPEEQEAENRTALQRLDEFDRVWLAYEVETPALARFRTELEQAYQRCEAAVDDSGLNLTLYARDSMACDSFTTP